LNLRRERIRFERRSTACGNAFDGPPDRADVRKRLPLSVHFDLTYRCNERCVHCYLDHEDHGELSTAECIDALEQLAKAGTLFLTFSGGEIFLRRDLEELLATARRLHFDVSLKTNALLVTPERAEMLWRHGVRRVQISVYSSDGAIHDAITKVPARLRAASRPFRCCSSVEFR